MMTDQHPNFDDEVKNAVHEEAMPKIAAVSILTAAAIAAVAIATGEEPELSTLEEYINAQNAETNICVAGDDNSEEEYRNLHEISANLSAHYAEHDEISELFRSELDSVAGQVNAWPGDGVVNLPEVYAFLESIADENEWARQTLNKHFTPACSTLDGFDMDME